MLSSFKIEERKSVLFYFSVKNYSSVVGNLYPLLHNGWSFYTLCQK